MNDLKNSLLNTDTYDLIVSVSVSFNVFDTTIQMSECVVEIKWLYALLFFIVLHVRKLYV